MAETTLAPDIRGVTIPVTGADVLLPNACVSEVITYGEPQPLADAPPWVLGAVSWRGWRMPLFSLARLGGFAETEPTSGAKVAILKAYGGVHRMPYMAMLAQGFPRLTAVTVDRLEAEAYPAEDGSGMLFRVRVDGNDAVIPDLDGIERELLNLVAPQVRGAEQDEDGEGGQP